MTTRPLRILHLEDEPGDAELVQAVLSATRVNCEIDCVSDREKFVAAIDRAGIDIILSDFAMPGFNGLSALSLAKKRLPDVPFIFVSGTIGEEAAIEAVRNGATDYVLKHRLSRLEPAVQRALSEAEERRKRREAEAVLEREQEFLKAMLESLDSGILACNAEGDLTLLNRATREIHGLPEGPVTTGEWARSCDLYGADGKTVLGSDDSPLHRALGGERLRNVELTVAPRNAPPRRILASGQPIIDAGGTKLGAVAVLNDVTERKQLEEQFRQAQKLEAIGRLAGGVAHDFNNLLSVIMGYVDLCLVDPDTDDALRERIENVKSATRRAAGLTRQLLTFSRKQVVEPRVIDLNDLLTGTVRMLDRLIGEDVEMSLVEGSDLGYILADPGQVEQIVMNLAVNARDAMPSGGSLQITTERVQLTEDQAAALHSGVVPGPHVKLSMADTGVGMSAEVLTHIFEPFFTTKGLGQGTGLGLATVYGIVHQCNGFIEVESAPGRGTCFRIYLPCVDQALEAAGTTESSTVPTGDKETILVVEDEAAVREVILETLVECGYRTLGARDADQAVRLFESHAGSIDLLMTDVVLPGMGGRDLVRRLVEEFPSLRVLYTSGYSPETATLERPPSGQCGFIQKPFALCDLARKVRELLDAPGDPTSPDGQGSLATSPGGEERVS